MSMSHKDANQVIRSVYSESDGALKTVPAAATSFTVELDAADGDSVASRPMAQDTTVLWNAISAGANNTSSAISVLDWNMIGLVFVASGLTGTLDGTITVETSLDNTTWINIGTVTTLDSASKSGFYNITVLPTKYIRFVYTKNNITAGSITLKYVLKG